VQGTNSPCMYLYVSAILNIYLRPGKVDWLLHPYFSYVASPLTASYVYEGNDSGHFSTNFPLQRVINWYPVLFYISSTYPFAGNLQEVTPDTD